MEYNAKSLMSIVRFWGEDITADQKAWLSVAADNLPEKEQNKFFDIYYSREC